MQAASAILDKATCWGHPIACGDDPNEVRYYRRAFRVPSVAFPGVHGVAVGNREQLPIEYWIVTDSGLRTTDIVQPADLRTVQQPLVTGKEIQHLMGGQEMDVGSTVPSALHRLRFLKFLNHEPSHMLLNACLNDHTGTRRSSTA